MSLKKQQEIKIQKSMKPFGNLEEQALLAHRGRANKPFHKTTDAT